MVVKNEKVQKRLRTILFSLPEDAFEELLDDVELFLAKTRNKFGSKNLHPQKMIKLNLQAYEVSEVYSKEES